MEQINVYFRKWPDGDTIALWDDERGFDISSYEHIGQYSPAHFSLINELEVATQKEYEPLKHELESIGYSVNVIEG